MDLVALEMIRSLQKLDTYNDYVVAVGPGDDKCLECTANFKVVQLHCANYLLWEQLLLPRLVQQLDADLLHCTSNTAPFRCRVPLVLTLHDIIFMEKRMGNNKSLYQNLGRIYRRFVVPKILRKATKIITVSHFEQNNIQHYYPELKNKVLTIYNGVSPQFKPITTFTVERLRQMEKGQHWFLLGNTDPKKNIKNTLKAYAYYLQHSSCKRKLLVADLTDNLLEDILRDLDLMSVREYIHVEKYIAHNVLAEMYTKAFAFLYPSLRESFGLPLLESMACGTPVVAADSSAIPEVAADSVVYVDPMDSLSIANGMLLLENDPVLYQEKIARGLERSKCFTWMATATRTLEVYKDMLRQKDGD